MHSRLSPPDGAGREAHRDRDPAGRFGDICGLDLSGLDRICEASRLQQGVRTLRPLSAPVAVAEFDLWTSDDRTSTRKAVEVGIVAGGIAHGLLQWIGFRFPDGTEFANPPQQDSSWARVFHEFAVPLAVEAGERRRLSVDQLGSYLAIGLA